MCVLELCQLFYQPAYKIIIILPFCLQNNNPDEDDLLNPENVLRVIFTSMQESVL